MDDACSQTFARKLERYFSIFVPKIQAKFQKYQNKWLSRRVIFAQKKIVKEVWPHSLNFLRKSFATVILRNLRRLTQVTEAAAFE